MKNNSSGTDMSAPQNIFELRRKLAATAEFLTPENLATLTLKYEGKVALLVVDVQKKFCAKEVGLGNDETVAVSKHIGSLAPEFRKASVPVYAVYCSIPGSRQTDFYEFEPCFGDVLIGKNRDSAFAGSNIRDILEKDHMKLLLICGFNLNACLKETISDARKAGFDVCLLRDLAGNGILSSGDEDDTRRTLEEMQQEGVMMAQSGEVLEQLKARSGVKQKLVVCRS